MASWMGLHGDLLGRMEGENFIDRAFKCKCIYYVLKRIGNGLICLCFFLSLFILRGALVNAFMGLLV